MAIISSNSPGSFTFKSLNNNIVSVTGNTVSINGIGIGEIEVTQAATSNFNEAKGILKVFVINPFLFIIFLIKFIAKKYLFQNQKKFIYFVSNYLFCFLNYIFIK